MFLTIIKNLFGSRNDRLLKKYTVTLKNVNDLEIIYENISNEELKKNYFSLKNNNNIEHLITHTYAIVREVAKRTINLRHFDVQILGGLALNDQKIAEIGTGEGKTLVATLPACLYPLLNKNIHIVTVNEYLAKRDANWMRPIYEFLEISVGIITSNMTLLDKKNAYKSNIIYGTSSEFGFDYLRDNIVRTKEEKVQNELFYAIIDEVDSILIDEARTPLIISTPDKINKNLYLIINKLVKKLNNNKNDPNVDDFLIDEENKQVTLTENGFLKLENLLKINNIIKNNMNLYETSNIELLHVVYATLKANNIFKKDIDYIVNNSEILIIDENTGRIMDGRRWSDGIHQAIEAKEMLPIKSENQILATITFQNYFRLYVKKCGMTGTALTEALEFENIYGLEVIVIPPNKKCIRVDKQDIIFIKKEHKYKAILNDIKSHHLLGMPLLIGTSSINTSEYLSTILKTHNIKHNVLNAKYHEKESMIIAEAGKLNSVTIATNMAGRGTDIILGGSEKKDYETIIKLGGLKIIGVERHESRRIDNQLKGRAGRQGDPGLTQFYLSLEDDLIRIFMGDKSLTILERLKIDGNETISNTLINKIIENAQKKIESHHFDIRKQILEYDNIINEQRNVFYFYRNSIIFSEDFNKILEDIIIDVVNEAYKPLDTNKKLLKDHYIKNLGSKLGINLEINTENNIKKEIIKTIYDNIKTDVNISSICKPLMLTILDLKWKEHLINLDLLKSGIHLRGYAQKDPKLEYKNESFYIFTEMLNNIKVEFINCLIRVLKHENTLPENTIDFTNNLIYNKDQNKNTPFVRSNNKIGRNDQCFCKSGKKYKYCHGEKK